MPRLEPAPQAKQDEVANELALIAAAMGFAPNSLKLMAHQPDMVRGFVAMAGAMLGPGAPIPPGLRQMIAYKASSAAGCTYCQAHTAHGAEKAGLSEAQIEALWDHENSDLFTPAEKAAMDLAVAAGRVPNEASDAHFEALKPHFNNEQITAIVGVISMFGFLNRWNDTLSTLLEPEPRAFADELLARNGWEVGNHG